MSKKKSSYTRHSSEYKTEALKLAKQVGVASAARQLGLHESQLYSWRKQAEHQRTISDRESALATENARLKRELAQAREEVLSQKSRPPTSRNSCHEI